jgi:uncharacterized phage protein gp47/JayE
MAWNRPSLRDRISRVQADLDSAIEGAAARLRRSVLGVLGKATAGVAHGLDAHIAYEARNIHTSTADEDTVRREAAEFDITPAAATSAAGTVTLAGAGTIDAGTVLQRADLAEFTTTAAVTVAGTADVAVQASVPGAAANTGAGVTLSFVSPVSGVSSEATVAAGGLTGGAEEEGVESLRARILTRKRTPPKGGASSDYAEWVQSVYPAATVWVYPSWMGAGTVGVSFVFWDRGGDDILPTDDEIEAVEDYLDTVRPAGMAGLYVFAPVLDHTNPEIHLIPDAATARAGVTASLVDLYRRESEPGGTVLISHFREAISGGLGEEDHVLVSPVANIAAAAGHLSVPGDIDWGD